MDWSDDGIILTVRPLGEGSVVLDALTAAHGRHSGLVRGGASRRMAGALQPGNGVRLSWRARLDEQLGSYTVELVQARAPAFFDDRLKLSGLLSLLSLASTVLPEREPHSRIYMAVEVLLGEMMALPEIEWLKGLVRWEILLLEDLGFGLDLNSCAATNQTHDLAYVSPKSHRAVSRAAGTPYQNKLLPLPAFLLCDRAEVTSMEIAQGFALTGFFIERLVLSPHGKAMPSARARLIERVTELGRPPADGRLSVV